MSLVTTKEMFEKAYNGGYAIGAFNVNNMKIVYFLVWIFSFADDEAAYYEAIGFADKN